MGSDNGSPENTPIRDKTQPPNARPSSARRKPVAVKKQGGCYASGGSSDEQGQHCSSGRPPARGGGSAVSCKVPSSVQRAFLGGESPTEEAPQLSRLGTRRDFFSDSAFDRRHKIKNKEQLLSTPHKKELIGSCRFIAPFRADPRSPDSYDEQPADLSTSSSPPCLGYLGSIGRTQSPCSVLVVMAAAVSMS